MRRLLVALGLFASIPNAFAGELDLPTLRGANDLVPASPTYFRWSGFYVGGQIGYGNSGMNFKDATQSLIAFMLRELALESEAQPSTWQVLGRADSRNTSFGGFIGYNTRFDDVVVGLDFNYSRTSFFATAPATPLSRLAVAGGNAYAVTVTGEASLRITDVGSLRARAGYAFDNWLTYATLGVAVGRANYSRSATVFGAENPPTGYPIAPCDPLAGCTEFSFTNAEGKSGALIYGWSAGGGVDLMVLPNVFVRAEYEYVSFDKVGEIQAYTAIGRLGVGVNF